MSKNKVIDLRSEASWEMTNKFGAPVFKGKINIEFYCKSETEVLDFYDKLHKKIKKITK